MGGGKTFPFFRSEGLRAIPCNVSVTDFQQVFKQLEWFYLVWSFVGIAAHKEMWSKFHIQII